MPGRYIPSASWLEMLSIDKLVHTGIFFVLGVLLILSSVTRYMQFSAAMVLLFLGACYGVLLEVGQASFFSGRSMEVLDAVANAAGIFGSAIFYGRLKRAGTDPVT